MTAFANLISAISGIFITITIPTFTFASTLLNKALTRLEKEKKDAVREGYDTIQDRIGKLQKQTKALTNKEGGQKRYRELQEKLQELIKEESRQEKRIKKID